MTRRFRVLETRPFATRPFASARHAFGILLAAVVLVLVVTIDARPASAMQLSPQQKQDVKLHYERATRAYDLNKYSEAVDEYQKVYEIDGDPVMLYNIGQAYRLNDQPQESIHFYRRYLQRSPEAKNRDDVNRKIVNLEKVIEDRRRTAAAVTPPPPPLTVGGTPVEEKPAASVPAAVSPNPTPAATLVMAPPAAVPPSDTQRIVGWSMVGAGVLIDGVAVVEGIRAKNFGDQLTQDSMKTTAVVFDPSVESSGKTANIVAIVCGIAGTAVAVAGAIVLITNGSSSAATPAPDGGTVPSPSASVSFTPWLGPGVAGGGMGLRF